MKMQYIFLILTTVFIVSSAFDYSKCNDENEEATWENVLSQLEERYDKKESMDTVLTVLHKNKPIKTKVYYELYCLKDSAINLPKEYIWSKDKSQKIFITHNFSVKIKIQSKLINIDTILTKYDIKILKQFSRDIYKYGTFQDFYLIKDKIKGNFDKIQFYFSFSIPMTDVGVGITLTILNNKLHFSI